MTCQRSHSKAEGELGSWIKAPESVPFCFCPSSLCSLRLPIRLSFSFGEIPFRKCDPGLDAGVGNGDKKGQKGSGEEVLYLLGQLSWQDGAQGAAGHLASVGWASRDWSERREWSPKRREVSSRWHG